MATQMNSCCPPGSHGALAANPTAGNAGQQITVNGGLEVYAVGAQTGGKGVLLIPDVWGWDSGRVREWADDLSTKLGAYCVVPKILSSGNAPFNGPFEGGTNGDGLPPTLDLDKRGKEAFPFILSFKWQDNIMPKMVNALTHMKEKGCTKIGGVGFCYGGWALVHCSAAGGDLVACAVPHPSVHLEGMHKGDPIALCGQAKCPFLMMPAGNDPDIYNPGTGAAMQKLPAGSESKPFPDMLHGWSIRGDLADAKIKRDAQASFDATEAYLGKYLNASKM